MILYLDILIPVYYDDFIVSILLPWKGAFSL